MLLYSCYFERLVFHSHSSFFFLKNKCWVLRTNCYFKSSNSPFHVFNLKSLTVTHEKQIGSVIQVMVHQCRRGL